MLMSRNRNNYNTTFLWSLLLILIIIIGISLYIPMYNWFSEPDILDSRMNSYIYQQFKVDDYLIKYGPDQSSWEKNILDEFLKEKTVLIHTISDYNSACLEAKKSGGNDCEIIEYNLVMK